MATVRLTGAAKNMIVMVLADVGAACAAYQDNTPRNRSPKRLQCDEIWCFVYAKAGNVRHPKGRSTGRWRCLDVDAINADTKLVPWWMIGGRDAGYGLEGCSQPPYGSMHRNIARLRAPTTS